MRSAALTGLTCVLLALLVPALAGADAYSNVETAYASAGNLPACEFSSRELSAALKQAPNYDLEYFGDFTDAIQTALSQQADGACSGRRAAVVSHARPTGSLARLRPPASPTAASGASIPLPLLLGLALAAAAALLGLVVVTARSRGWDPEWAIGVRHSWSEAEYRLSGAWESFRDWLSAGH